MPLVVRSIRFALLLDLALALLAVSPARANTIFVTTLQQKIGGPGGCSLQEAILAANQDTDAFLAFGPTGNQVLINSACTAGSGDDVIVLPTGGALFQMSVIIDDANNPTGPTATPIITSTITIQGNGATLQWVNAGLNARAFAVGNGGNLTLNQLFITGFIAKGGNGAGGGGGGMGAGGAIYVESGALTITNCTFSNNSALGGAGSTTDSSLGNGGGGGGGGLGGNGGPMLRSTAPSTGINGGGGGGSRGNGGRAGGGTIIDYITCGGNTGIDPGVEFFADGESGECPGGGGGGGAGLALDTPIGVGGDGGNGNYGGGGGGGGEAARTSHGGIGGFGGGGGAPGTSDAIIGDGSTGGHGGYGGGGAGANGTGDGHAGAGGKFAGQGDPRHGGGGAALGGAIFSHSGGVTIQNSTFSENHVIRGNSGGGAADNGQDEGAAIFAVNGSLTVEDSTISGNTSTGEGAGIVVDVDPFIETINGNPFTIFPPTFFNLHNTIVSNPSLRECFYDQHVTSLGDGNLIVSDNSNNLSNFLQCPGIVTNQPPFLSPLQINLPGIVPTLAIRDGVNDPAFNSAAGGLPFDERGIPRPQGGGFDIGAYELCFDDQGPFDRHCENTGRPEASNLTIQVSPAGAGITNPAEGVHGELPGSLVALTATANPGFSFTGWTGPVGDPNSASTSVLMSSDETVTATFVAISKTLTIHVSPAGAGTTIPSEGQHSETPGSVVPLNATANPGYSFVSWSGPVANPGSAATSVTMTDSETVTGNFVALNTTMAGNIISKAGPSNARVWTLSLLDNGPGAANTTLINSFTLTQTFGAACTPILKNAFPLSLGNIGPGQTGTTTLTIDFTGCAASARFTAKFTFSANNGAVSGFVTRTNQYQ